LNLIERNGIVIVLCKEWSGLEKKQRMTRTKASKIKPQSEVYEG
jgi:hypothetical protein